MFDFKDYDARLGGVELRPLVTDDWSTAPKVWDNDIDMHAQLLRVTGWAKFDKEDGSNPDLYIRMNELDKVRDPYGIIHLGTGIQTQHTSAHHTDIAQGGANVIPYQKIETNPDVYQQTSDAPFCQLTYTEDGVHYIEGDEGSVLDLKGERFPFVIFYHSDSPMAAPYYIQFLDLTGTYEGKPVHVLGGADRIFVPKDTGENGMLTPIRKAKYSPLTYIHFMGSGIRKDGKKEVCSFLLSEMGAHGLYWVEGEEPYMTTNVSLEADWQPTGYLPEDDQTMAFTKATWKFDDREVHFTADWGSKGFGAEPRTDIEGLVEVFGPWYEGSEPYDHDLDFTFFEISRMPKDVLIDLGLMN